MNAYTTAAAAIARSISHDEVARVALDETISGVEDKIAAMLVELRALGLEDYSEENDGSIKAWGEREGGEWTVRTVDGLTHSVRYVD
jgi:hypothetical protein